MANPGSITGGQISDDSISPAQAYIDHLKEELKIATRRLNKANANKARAAKEHNNALGWKNLLGTYKTNITLTHDLASSLLNYFESIQSQGIKVCTNVEHLRCALEFLVSCIYETSVEVEKLKFLMKSLMDRIDCINDSGLDPNVSIMKCLSDFQKMIDEAMTLVLTTIMEILKTVEAGNELRFCICNDENGNYGFKFMIEQDIELLKNATRCGPSSTDDPPSPTEIGPCGIKEKDPSCLITDKPCVITGINDCPTNYFDQLIIDYETACRLLEEKECVLNYYSQCREQAQAQYDAISTALAAAQVAKAC